MVPGRGCANPWMALRVCECGQDDAVRPGGAVYKDSRDSNGVHRMFAAFSATTPVRWRTSLGSSISSPSTMRSYWYGIPAHPLPQYGLRTSLWSSPSSRWFSTRMSHMKRSPASWCGLSLAAKQAASCRGGAGQEGLR